MCIIAAKPAGVKLPTAETIRAMWAANPDGAGIMWADEGRVHIRKGFMHRRDFLAAIDVLTATVDLERVSVVLHFRVRTHGKTAPECCHPFPLSGSLATLKKLDCTARVGVAHNGIIPGVDPAMGISDTMQFIVDFLAPLAKGAPTWYKDKNLRRAVEAVAQSRLAVLAADGTLTTLGQGWTTCDGIAYSNGSYRPAAWTLWGDDATDDMRELMWLPAGAYVVDDSGGLMDGSEYLMDAKGALYYYDVEADVALLADGIAYVAGGALVRFDPCGDVEALPVLSW